MPESRRLQDVWDLLSPRMRCMLARNHIPSADADDILQEAALSFLQQSGNIDNAEAWLLVVVKFRCSMYLRRQARWQKLVHPMDPDELQAIAKPLAPPQVQMDVCQDLARLARDLGKDEQRLLYQLFFQNLGRTQVAAQLGCHPANIPKVLRRILTRLRTAFDVAALP